MSYYDDVYLAAPEYDEREIECECGNYEYFTEKGDKWEGKITCDECGEIVSSWCNDSGYF